MARDIRTKAHLQGGEIHTKANFGQTVAITVLPDPYEGDTTVTPSDERQTLPTRGKTVATDITVLPAPTESLTTSENGTFVPSPGNIGFSEVVVDVEPSLESLSVTENGLYLPSAGVDGYDRVIVNVPPTVPDLRSLTVTENGSYLPDGFDGYSEVNVNVPTGGGGGLTLLDTMEVNGVNGVQTDIDMSWFDTYDYVMMVPDLTFSRNDWPYIVQDATTGGGYASSMSSMGVQQSVFLGMTGSKLWGAWFRDSQSRPQPYELVSYLYWYLYNANNTMTGTIKIYGIKVTA